MKKFLTATIVLILLGLLVPGLASAQQAATGDRNLDSLPGAKGILA